MKLDVTQNDKGRWIYRVLDIFGQEVGRSIVGYPTREAAREAGLSPEKVNARCDLRANENGLFGWKAVSDGKLVGENTLWFDDAAAAILNAHHNGFAVSVGDGVKIPTEPTDELPGAAPGSTTVH